MKKIILIMYLIYFGIWFTFISVDVFAQTTAKEEIILLRAKVDELKGNQIKNIETVNMLQQQLAYENALQLDKRLTQLEYVLKLGVAGIGLIGGDRLFQLARFLYDNKKKRIEIKEEE